MRDLRQTPPTITILEMGMDSFVKLSKKGNKEVY